MQKFKYNRAHVHTYTVLANIFR